MIFTVSVHFLEGNDEREDALLKNPLNLTEPDPYYAGTVGFVGCALEDLHQDMHSFELPAVVPDCIRKSHDAIRHAYIYAYFSYDLLTLAAGQTFPSLELALRERIGYQFEGRKNKKGKPQPAMLDELLRAAKSQKLISSDIDHLSTLRNKFAHGSDAVLNLPMFLIPFKLVTQIVSELFSSEIRDLLRGREAIAETQE